MNEATRINFKLLFISLASGSILLLFLWLVSPRNAFILLFNFDYIPGLKVFSSSKIAGIIFHYLTCYFSVVVLFYFLKMFGLKKSMWIYIIVYTVGGAGLYFLTALSPQPPQAHDTTAWLLWTVGHGIFGVSLGLLIKKMI